MEKKYLYLKYYFKYLWFVMLSCIIISCVDHLSFIFWKWFTFLFQKWQRMHLNDFFFQMSISLPVIYCTHHTYFILHLFCHSCSSSSPDLIWKGTNTNTYNPPNSNWDENSVHITSASLGKITFTLFFKITVRPVVFTLKAELKESVTWLINL